MYTVRIDTKDFTFEKPMTVEELITTTYNGLFVSALVDGNVIDMNTVIDHDCRIVPLTLSDEDGQRIYSRTLKYVFIMAVRHLFPKATVRFLYSLSRGLYCEIDGEAIDPETVKAIDLEMKSIISRDIPIEYAKLPKKELVKIYSTLYPEKVKYIKCAKEAKQTVYKCEDEYNYLNGAMMPRTGYVRQYKLVFHSPGIVLMYPRYELNGKIPEFDESVKFDRMLWRAEEWGKISGVREIADLNEKIASGNIKEFINMCEIKHENDISFVTDEIANNIRNNKVILIAGPSSSGKTTFSKRVQLHLAVKGIRAVRLSTDDFFYPIDDMSPEEIAKLDLEHLDRVDTPLFNKTLNELIAGREVEMPVYDFETHTRKAGDTCRIGDDECIIIEGIHGLNEQLTSLVPRYNKYKIYISALTHINVDVHTPASTTTCRLIRRSVRDHLYRGCSINDTFGQWQSVRNGEFRWIYPYQDEADFTMNSELAYELAVMKKHIVPLLREHEKQYGPYFMADKISKLIRNIDDIDDELVPSTSILREFIGGSNY